MHDRAMRAIVSLLAVIAMSGCEYGGGTAGPLRQGFEPPTLIATERPTYSAGRDVSFRLTNRTGTAVGYNLCRSRLERLDGDGGWRPIMASLGEVCTAELRTLRPGQSVTYAFKTEPKFRPGDYRIATDLEDLQGRTRFTAVSNVFPLTRDD